jgi:hypothetical protein
VGEALCRDRDEAGALVDELVGLARQARSSFPIVAPLR